MATKRRNDKIIIPQCSTNANSGGLLTLALVNRSRHRPFEEKHLHALLELADYQNALIERQHKFAGKESGAARLRERYRSLARRFFYPVICGWNAPPTPLALRPWSRLSSFFRS